MAQEMHYINDVSESMYEKERPCTAYDVRLVQWSPIAAAFHFTEKLFYE